LKNITKDNIEYFDIDRLKLPLFIRRFKKGDYIFIDKRRRKKKLSDLFIDEKIDRRLRNIIPVIVDDEDNVLLILGLRRSYIAYLQADTKNVLTIQMEAN
jgi:tRNA(Ile)-lysidine synthase